MMKPNPGNRFYPGRLSFIGTILLLLAAPLFPCSTLSYRHGSETIVGRNYDFSFGEGMLVTNKRNTKKMGLISTPKYMKYAASWSSRYGSVTFNQFGRELPTGGMNEKGLVVELMWLLGTTKGEDAVQPLPSVNELQWIQYQLDRFETTAQVIDHLGRLQVIATASTLHYHVCDQFDDCAIVELMDGKPVSYHGADGLPDRVLTNTPYSLTRSGELPQNLSGEEKAQWEESYRRFHTLQEYLSSHDASTDPVSFTFEGLDLVKARIPWHREIQFFFAGEDPGTQWQIVYSTQKKEIHFRTKRNPEIRVVKLDGFAFSCSTPVKVMDLNEGEGGDAIEVFHTYRREDNERIIRNTMDRFNGLQKAKMEFLIDVPEKFPCTE